MLSREEFQEIYDTGAEATYGFVRTLLARTDSLEQRVAQVEEHRATDSHNSHKPPSSDGLARPTRGKHRSLREVSGKRPGAQPGHPGHTLAFVEQPDAYIVHAPASCAHCGTSLEGCAAVKVVKRQVHDLPPRLLHVTEHRGESKRCPQCQHTTAALFPAGVEQPVQYGPRIGGLFVYLKSYQLLPFARTRELLAVLFGHAPAAGTLTRALTRARDALSAVEEKVRAALIQAPTVHMDETGVRVEGRTQWLHTTSTATETLLTVHTSRGRPAVDAIGILSRMQGVRIHDALPSYLSYGGRFALCNAHLLRDLISVAETTRQLWALHMLALLREMKAATDHARSEGAAAVAPEVRAALERRYEALLAEGDRAHPEPPQRSGRRGGRLKRTPAQNLIRRMRRHREAVLYFLRDLSVPFDNNQAERDLRMAKVQQKVSGCFRTLSGAETFARIRGYLSTLRKQNLPILPALSDTLQGHPRMPA